MSPTLEATTVRHLKVRAYAGGYLLEPCEDAECTVAPDGRTGCGRTACPTCGDGALPVSVSGWDGGFATCGCGTSFPLAR